MARMGTGTDMTGMPGHGRPSPMTGVICLKSPGDVGQKPWNVKGNAGVPPTNTVEQSMSKKR